MKIEPSPLSQVVSSPLPQIVTRLSSLGLVRPDWHISDQPRSETLQPDAGQLCAGSSPVFLDLMFEKHPTEEHKHV